ncbi:Transcription factor, fungi [Lecanosticta acicola]|uniref:Transcription factor, fungi n=1 Tax=Lecanosticta acicola TaxID=111012 RepID=A0AAI8YYE6_9PEZI|nr:Transcription factor, fungi [Lecanosticta acicola]
MDAQESPGSNHEIGSLTQPSPHESRFIGSSSGIYFINTVKQAFEQSGRQCGSLPAAEDTVGGEDDYASARNSPAREREHGLEVTFTAQGAIEIHNSANLGLLLSFEVAQQLAIEYFKTWHPLLPFLSGPEFLRELHALYQDPRMMQGPGTVLVDRRQLCFLVILQCVLGVGASGSSTAGHMPFRPDLLQLVSSLASRHDMLTVQTVLAAQVYCVSQMALRTASSLGGLLSKLLYHAGLHRCPYRYPQLSNEDRDLRKRVIWSSFALDRYICQALGIPVSLTEAEIDVCIPGRDETHGRQTNGSEAKMPAKPTGIPREIILSNFVDHGRLVGRALEIFHVSIHTRSHDPRMVLFLRSDVDRWFNSLPEEPIITPESSAAEEQIARFLPFFHVLYEQLVISTNRPSLSLPRNTPEFHHGLQVTIRAAKRTIVAMEKQTNLFWPGYLAAVWMSGLVISFACQIGLYTIDQGSQEILRCLDLLKRMSGRWRSASRCHAALSVLLSNLQQGQRRTSSDAFGHEDPYGPSAKQRRLKDTASPMESKPVATPADDASDTNQSAASNAEGLVPATDQSDNMAGWDASDFLRDLSWNNLFDINDLAQASDLPFLPG